MSHASYKSPREKAFSHYLRTGQRLPEESFVEEPDVELKFNPYHDPRNGQFTFAPGHPHSPGGVIVSDRPGTGPRRAAGHYHTLTKPRTYTVHRGDTLSHIARRHGVRADALARANNIKHPDHIREGQTLRIPPHASSSPVQSPRLPMAQSDAASNDIVVIGKRRSENRASISSDASTSISSQAVTDNQLRSIMPGSGQRAEDYADALNQAMTEHGIDTPQQRAAFLAQLSVESGNLRSTEENLNYSAKRLTQVWPKRFPTTASAQPYSHNPEALANHVYANRLGNGDEASGDGYRYRGRGLLQITGRENYRKIGYEDDPDALTDPYVAADTAAQFWSDRNLNSHSETKLNRDQFNVISRTVNGGNNGSQERWDAYQRGLSVLLPQR